jgi:agmatine deiminase
MADKTAAAATPRAQGYRMPAEWEPHEATWLAWPHNPEDWPGKFQAIPWLYAEVVRLIAAHELVHLVVEGASAESRIRSILDRAGANLDKVQFHLWPTNRSWTRDTGPIFVLNDAGKIAITDWRFNAWAKYDDWQLDDKLPAKAAKALKLQSWQAVVRDERRAQRRIVLEGGSIDTNGQGILLTTEECMLSEVQQRNPGLSREQMERAFNDYLGVVQVLWLGRGIAGDDTHGHVDDITRFVGPETILTVVEPDTTDPNHEPLAENLARLRAARTLDGKQFTLVELPMPRPVVFRGQRLPASYANFYIANGLVLVPTFHDPSDRIALNIISELFPAREVIGIHAVDLVWGLGTLHCMTQQQPAAGLVSTGLRKPGKPPKPVAGSKK